MSKKVVVFEESIKFQHEIVIDDNVAEGELEKLIDDACGLNTGCIDEITALFRERLGDRMLKFIPESDWKSEGIECLDVY